MVLKTEPERIMTDYDDLVVVGGFDLQIMIRNSHQKSPLCFVKDYNTNVCFVSCIANDLLQSIRRIVKLKQT